MIGLYVCRLAVPIFTRTLVHDAPGRLKVKAVDLFGAFVTYTFKVARAYRRKVRKPA